jgi:hypothetical protein
MSGKKSAELRLSEESKWSGKMAIFQGVFFVVRVFTFLYEKRQLVKELFGWLTDRF